MKYWPLFALIQLVNFPLMVLGWLICLSPGLARDLWLWWNDDNPPDGDTWWQAYKWLAWRNPVANLRRVRGVAGPGRPLFYWSNQKHYVKIGWESGPPYYPVMSAGAGKGY